MTELADLPKAPVWAGSLTTQDYDRLMRKSTVKIPKPYREECWTCGLEGQFKSWDLEGRSVIDYRCNCRDQYVLSMELLSRGIDHEYQRLDWYDLGDRHSDHMENSLFDYADNAHGYVGNGLGLTLHGKPGTGKSLMLYLLAKNLIGQGIDVYFTQHLHLIDLYKSGWTDKEDREYFKSRCFRSQVLFIDDFGTERDTTMRMTEDTLIDQIFRTRSSNDLATFVSTNLDPVLLEPEAKSSKYDSRVRSLLSGKNETIVVEGEDYRPTRLRNRREEIKLGISRPVTLG